MKMCFRSRPRFRDVRKKIIRRRSEGERRERKGGVGGRGEGEEEATSCNPITRHRCGSMIRHPALSSSPPLLSFSLARSFALFSHPPPLLSPSPSLCLRCIALHYVVAMHYTLPSSRLILVTTPKGNNNGGLSSTKTTTSFVSFTFL